MTKFKFVILIAVAVFFTSCNTDKPAEETTPNEGQEQTPPTAREQAPTDTTNTEPEEKILIATDFPDNMIAVDGHEAFDLYYSAEDESIITGVVTYDKADLKDEAKPEDILDSFTEQMSEGLAGLKTITERNTVSKDGKIITSECIYGESTESKDYYLFHLVTFDEFPDKVAFVLQLSVAEQWAQNEPILQGILDSLKFTKSAE